MSEKLLLWKFRKITQKNVFSSVPFKKFGLSNPPTYNFSENWFHQKYFLFLFREFSELLGERLSVVESLFRKVTETSPFSNSVGKSNTCMVSAEK